MQVKYPNTLLPTLQQVGESGSFLVRVHIWTLEIWITGQIQVTNPVQVYTGSSSFQAVKDEVLVLHHLVKSTQNTSTKAVTSIKPKLIYSELHLLMSFIVVSINYYADWFSCNRGFMRKTHFALINSGTQSRP